MSSQTGYISNNEFQHQCTWFMDVTYVNEVTLQPETVTISYPLTIDYTITKNTEANTNTANFKIHNLNKTTRSHLFQERFNTGVKKLVTFYAGYNGQEKEVFKGYIMEAYSERQGTEVITTIDCWDMGIGEKWISVTFEKGTTFKDAYKNIVSQLPNIELGAIGELDGAFKTPVTFAGTPFNILNKITNRQTFIDNGTVITLQNNECLDVPVFQINASSGLLATPQRRGGQMVVQSVFQPEIKIGQLYEIKTEIMPDFDGTYKVCGFTHHGTISGSSAGQRMTEINLLVGAILPNSNYVYTYTTESGFKKVKAEEVSSVNETYGASVEEVYRYMRDTQGGILDKPITNEISWANMIGNENNNSDRYNELTKAKLYNCETIAKRLQKYKNAYYPNKRLNIVSGWRSTRVNSKWGGQTGKHGHLYGNAIDFNIIGIADNTVLTSSLKKYWWQQYKSFSLSHKAHLHVQNDGVTA